ncbi:hypothetical protein AB0B45_45295 [Nonomuraea sp. NPDC049152]|uniref:hypothetical protein n=1 Tax=Nonomuraea sp. NPDC049152 TaxID=3154350 RepID=UPI0033E0EF27
MQEILGDVALPSVRGEPEGQIQVVRLGHAIQQPQRRRLMRLHGRAPLDQAPCALPLREGHRVGDR